MAKLGFESRSGSEFTDITTTQSLLIMLFLAT